jgi:SAM-dependent methyltransferase
VDDLARQYVLSYYDRLLRMFGDRPEALRWNSKGQVLHYEALLDIADSIDGKKVLDFGCGRGDFFWFLKQRGIQVHYTGLDINEKLIDAARDKNPGALFKVFDIERESLDEDFDYIFLCGVFNLRVEGVEELIMYSLKKLFSRCKAGLAFNAPSSHNPKKDFEMHYVSPEELSAFALRDLSPFVSVRQGRIPYEFTMFVYKEVDPSF